MFLQSLQHYRTFDRATLTGTSELKILLPQTAFLATCTHTHMFSDKSLTRLDDILWQILARCEDFEILWISQRRSAGAFTALGTVREVAPVGPLAVNTWAQHNRMIWQLWDDPIFCWAAVVAANTRVLQLRTSLSCGCMQIQWWYRSTYVHNCANWRNLWECSIPWDLCEAAAC